MTPAPHQRTTQPPTATSPVITRSAGPGGSSSQGKSITARLRDVRARRGPLGGRPRALLRPHPHPVARGGLGLPPPGGGVGGHGSVPRPRPGRRPRPPPPCWGRRPPVAGVDEPAIRTRPALLAGDARR